MMDKFVICLLAFLLCGCADYATNASVDGVSRPGDLMPQPFPDPKPTSQN